MYEPFTPLFILTQDVSAEEVNGDHGRRPENPATNTERNKRSCSVHLGVTSVVHGIRSASPRPSLGDLTGFLTR